MQPPQPPAVDGGAGSRPGWSLLHLSLSARGLPPLQPLLWVRPSLVAAKAASPVARPGLPGQWARKRDSRPGVSSSEAAPFSGRPFQDRGVFG